MEYTQYFISFIIDCILLLFAVCFIDIIMEEHRRLLSLLCRICQSQVGRYKYAIKDHIEHLNKMFAMKFEEDSSEVHPPSMCLKCKALVGNYRKDQSIPTIIPTIWKAYTPNSAECDGKLIAKITKGGRP